MRIECPYCATSYTAERCGLALTDGQRAHATIACGLCQQEFNVVVMPRESVTQPGWFARVFLGRQPLVEVSGHTVESFAKE